MKPALAATFHSIALFLALSSSTFGQEHHFSLESPGGLTSLGVTATPVTFKGVAALHVQESADAGAHRLVLLDGVQFENGTILLDVVGMPRSDAGEGARGFVGLAFRVADEASLYECFYLRPTNARAEDQLRRNHTLQYVSEPDWPWHRLRTESPGVYESYADMVPGEWTTMKVEVAGSKARLFLHGAEQPSLIVNDLKMGDAGGGIALWIGPGTDAYFSNLRIHASGE